MLEKVYYVCFFVGCIYAALSFLLGGVFDLFGLDLYFDLHHFDFEPFLPIKPFVLMAFVTVFGGTGLVLLKMPLFVYIAPWTVVVSGSCAFLVSKALYHYIYIPLTRFQTTVKKQSSALGVEATILETILPNKYGRISYTIDGNILSGIAKEKYAGNGFKKGEVVVIDEIKDNVFYVIRKPQQ